MNPYRPAWPLADQDSLAHVLTEPGMGTVWKVEVLPELEPTFGIIGVVKERKGQDPTITIFFFRIDHDPDDVTLFDEQPAEYAHLVVRADPDKAPIWTTSGSLYAMCILTGDWTPLGITKVPKKLRDEPAPFNPAELDELEGTMKPPEE